MPPFGSGAAPPTVGARAVPPQLVLPLVPVARCSAELHDLLDALLDKQARLRPSWAQLREHPFWKVRVEAEPIPPQRAYEAWLQARPTTASSLQRRLLDAMALLEHEGGFLDDRYSAGGARG